MVPVPPFTAGEDSEVEQQLTAAAATADDVRSMEISQAELRQSVARRQSVATRLPPSWSVHLTDDAVPYYVNAST